MKWYALVIFLMVACITVVCAAQVEEEPDTALRVLVEDSVHAVTPMWDGWILYSAGDDAVGNAGLTLLDTATGQSFPWEHTWDPVTDGWAGFADTPVYSLTSSPNGQWVCLIQTVMLPDTVEIQYDGMRTCEAIILCQADGSKARVAGLSIMVGGGPHVDFTADGMYIVGSPLLECIPDAAHYAAMLNADGDQPGDYHFNHYTLSTGARWLLDDLDTGDGYWKCPYSDNYRIENNWYDEHRFSNFNTGGLLGEYVMPGDSPGGMAHGWVLPDAMLVSDRHGSGLLYVDGTYVPAPSGDWDCYCWLPDGTYIFSIDGGETVRHGKVDWPTFTVDWWVDHAELPAHTQDMIIPLRDSCGVLLDDWVSGRLTLAPLSRENSRP